MIKRNIPKKLIPVENLTEGLTVGASGIDVTSPPTKSNTVYDMENLDVALDNSLSLRKPLLYNHKVNDISEGSIVEYMFDDKELEIFTGDIPTIGYVNVENSTDVKYPNVYINIDDPTDTIDANEVFFRRPYGLHIHGYGDLDIVNDLGQSIPLSSMAVDVNNLQVVNTNTSSIIFGFRFNLNDSVLRHYAKTTDLKSGDTVKYRPIKITKEDGIYKAEVLQIEVPTLYVDSASNVTRVYFNMMDDYTYSFRDNYDAGYTYCNGVVAYTPKNNTLTTEDIMEYTVEELTESDKFIIVDSLTRDEVSKKFILKAFCTHTFTETPGYSVYCTWEKSYDNVTWNPVQEFLDAPFASNIVYLDIKDASKSYESLEQAYEYTRRVPYAPFNITGTQDVLGNRPDVLILDSMDSAIYRFTIRSVAVPTVGDTVILSHTITPSSGFLNLDNEQNYIAIDNTRQATFTIIISYTFAGNAEAEVENNLRVLLRSVYADNAGSGPTSAERAFENTLNDTSLNAVCNPEVAFDHSYNRVDNVTTMYKEITIPITLAEGWIAQKMCLKAVLFDNSVAATEDNALCIDTFDAIVGFNNLGEPTSSPLFTYYADKLVTGTSYMTGSVNNPNNHIPYALFTNPNNANTTYIGCGSNGAYDMYSYDDNTYTFTASLTVRETKSKTRLPISMLNNLAHAYNTAPRIYILNTYKYLLKNITVEATLTLNNVLIQWQHNYWSGIIPHEDTMNYLCNAKLNISMSLYDYLTMLSSASLYPSVAQACNSKNYDVSVIRVTNTTTLETEGSWETLDKSGYLYNVLIPVMFEDVAAKVLTSGDTVSASASVTFRDAPLVNPTESFKQYSLKNVNTEIIGSTATFKYTDSSWSYGNVSNTLYLKDSGGTALIETVTTPESYTTYDNAGHYHSTCYQPFKYVTWCDTSSTPIQAILKVGEDVNLKTIYNALISTDTSMRYNVQYEVLSNSKYPDLSETMFYKDRYSLELASTPYTALFTNVKQINDYRPINIYSSNKIYYNHRVWFYGRDLKNNIYFSNADSSTVPMDNSLTLSTDMDDFVTALVPWKDYLVALTKNKIFLISKYSDSYVFKQVNTFVGTPEIDGNTCKAILNGVIFKSGTKVFVLHPNMYSSDDTILNITDISKPIAHHLIEGTDNFAIATEYEYFLFIPRTKDTLVFKYEYSRKVWSKFTYPVVLEKAKLFSVGDIQVVDSNNIVYDFDKTLEWFKTKHDKEMLEYGDYLDDTLTNTAISFYLDTGQKSSNIQNTKQFTESKFIIATMDVKDTFPIQTAIYVDGISLVASHKYMAGNLQLITTDASTDGAFSKTNPEDIAYLNTNIVTDNSDILNVMRQMILRYMGKGKTIRHVLKGNSTFNFKIYVLYYRYRMPHNKQ